MSGEGVLGRGDVVDGVTGDNGRGDGVVEHRVEHHSIELCVVASQHDQFALGIGQTLYFTTGGLPPVDLESQQFIDLLRQEDLSIGVHVDVILPDGTPRKSPAR